MKLRRRRMLVMAGAAVAVVAACVPVAGAATLFVVEGGGWGDGVGLGQWGAEGYAVHGWRYRQIVEHYYPHTALTRVKDPTVRVLLALGERQVVVGSREPFLLVDARGHQVHVPARMLRFGPRLRFGGRRLIPPVRVEAGAAVLSLAGQGYRGTLTLLPRGRGLEVINTLPLERYLRGVVAAEMPKGWLPAAYEAQAVAARSYALARLGNRGAFDLYSDTRDQVYGGIAAERTPTDEAVGDTQGQVLTYAGRPILAYYSASTGGRTDTSQAAFPGRAVPYLVSVADPYDTLSPLHRWRVPLDLGRLQRTFGFPVLDLRVRHDAADYAATVTLIGAHTSKTMSGRQLRQTLGLRSRRFSIAAISLDPPPPRAAYQQPFTLHGYIRGLSNVSLQQLTPSGNWRLLAKLHSNANGRFTLTVHARNTTAYRLAVQQLAGPPAAVQVAPRLTLKTDGNILSGTVTPALPLQIERETDGNWRPNTRLTVGPSGYFRTKLDHGRYRISTTTSRHLATTTSPPLTINR